MLSLVLVASIAGSEAARVSKRSEQQTIAGVEVRNYRPGVEDWIITFAEGTSDDQINQMCGGDCQLKGSLSTGGVAWAAVKGTGKLERMLSTRRAAAVKYLMPDVEDYAIPIIREAEVEGEGRYFTSSWGLQEIGVPSRSNIGTGVNIYVQDTGIRTTHIDFFRRAVPELDVSSGEAVKCNGNGNCARDRQGHGTHCAGTAGGNEFGVAAGAKIYAVKTLSDSGSGARSWQYEGVSHVTANGKKPAVLSMSLGGGGQDATYTGLINAATATGVVVVVAAGNDNQDACGFSPAFVESAITVGATSQYNSRATYSNWGTCVNIMAPGSAIRSSWYTDDDAKEALSGTSMACPHVSGAAALVLSATPGMSSPDVRRNIMGSALSGKVNGLMSDDPDLFLNVAGDGSAPVPTPAPPTPPPPPPPPTGECKPYGSTGPDADGDCRCPSGTYCYENGRVKCTFSKTQSGYSVKSPFFFVPWCATCECK